MIAKLYHTLAIISIAIVLAGGGLTGMMYGTGKITPERIDQITKILRGEEPAVEATAAAVTDNQGNPSTLPAKSSSADEVRRQRREEQLLRALGERAARDRASQRQLLDQTIQHLVMSEEKFERDKQRWKAEMERRQTAADDKGFAKELSIVSKLPSQLAKEHIIKKWNNSPADAVRLINALPESTSKKIFSQMKTSEETEIMHELLEQLGKNVVE